MIQTRFDKFIMEGENRVAVIGYSCSGKTTLTKGLAGAYPEYKVWHTDDFINEARDNYKQAMYDCFNAMLASGENKVIVEGVNAYRLLRKGLETGKMNFDLIIICQADDLTRTNRYITERDAKSVHKLMAFDANLSTVFRDYANMCVKAGKEPRILKYNT